MKNYYDKQIIPLKVRNSEAEAMSLDTGYYIEGRLETFRIVGSHWHGHGKKL